MIQKKPIEQPRQDHQAETFWQQSLNMLNIMTVTKFSEINRN